MCGAVRGRIRVVVVEKSSVVDVAESICGIKVNTIDRHTGKIVALSGVSAGHMGNTHRDSDMQASCYTSRDRGIQYKKPSKTQRSRPETPIIIQNH
jgi:hypothetical protein